MAEHHEIDDAPPSYDEVVGSPVGSPDELPRTLPVTLTTPTAPSLIQETRFTDLHHTTSHGTLPPSINAILPTPVDVTTSLPTLPAGFRRKLSLYQRYASFNSIRYMVQHWGTIAMSDLDVEHHIPSSRAAYNASGGGSQGRIYSYRIFLILLSILLIGTAVVLPVFMVLAGVIQYDDCPYKNNRLANFIVIGGIVLGVLTCLRFANCCVFFLGSDRSKETNACTGCLTCLESLFIIAAIVYLLVLAYAAQVVLFSDEPKESCPADDPDCDDFCVAGAYDMFATLVRIQLSLIVLFLFTFFVLLMGVRHCCCVQQQTVHITQ